jgi:hypothetical protein
MLLKGKKLLVAGARYVDSGIVSVWLTIRELVAIKRVHRDVCYCPFCKPSTRWRATELWGGPPERSCVELLRLLVWRKCRMCPNHSAGPLRLFTDRNPAGFWRLSLHADIAVARTWACG